jgi:hypothetical protein
MTMKREEWQIFRKDWKISKGKLSSILLDLQEFAVNRGLIVERENVLSGASRAVA